MNIEKLRNTKKKGGDNYMKIKKILATISLLSLFAMMGMPAMHELSGKDFGAAVKEKAQTQPGAVAEHVRT